MNSSEVENVDNTANTKSSGNSTRSIKQLFQGFLKSYHFIPSGENVFTNLVCFNTVYLLFVFWIVLITSLLYTSPVRDKIEEELNTCMKNPGGRWKLECESYHSVESITNRTGFTLATSFIILALFSTYSERIHQEFWLTKFLLILIFLPICFLIPTGRFDFVWSIICFIGGLVFHFIEVVLILDFATNASDIFVKKITEERSRLWYLVWLLLNWTIYVTAIGITMILFVFYQDGCGLNYVLVTAVLVLCALWTLLVVYLSENRTGFLHSGLSTLYMLLLTLVTLSHEGFCQSNISTTKLKSGTELSSKILNHFEIVLGFLLVTYAVLRNYNEKYYHTSGLTVSRHFVARRKDESIEAVRSCSEDEVKDDLVFNAFAFFAMFAAFSLFATSKLTSLRAAKCSEPIIEDLTRFYIRSFTILLILILMIWSVLFPVVYPTENPFDLSALGRTFLKYQLKLCRRLLIDGCGCCNGPIVSRCIFSLLYILGVSFSCLLYIPEIRHSLSKSTYFCPTISTHGVCLSTDPAYMAVYRVCIAMATFYLLFALILVCVDDVRDPRVDLQYKAWPVKICLFCSLLLASFLLPNEFSRIWIYTALIGTFLFTLLQLMLLIYWSKTTAIILKEKVENSKSKTWSILLIFLIIFMIVLFLAAIITFYVFFSKYSRCLTNTVLITLNLVLVIITSLLSVHPKMYNVGLFQCYIIVTFSIYLTWSGLSHNPDENCNPVAGYIAEVDMRPNLNIQAGLDILLTFLTVIYYTSKAPSISESLRNATEIFRSVYGTCVQRPSAISVAEVESQRKAHFPMYNFSLFHGVYFLASLHSTVILTNWFIPTSASRFKLSVNWAAMCVKMTCSNFSLLIYFCIISTQIFTE